MLTCTADCSLIRKGVEGVKTRRRGREQLGMHEGTSGLDSTATNVREVPQGG